MARSSKPRAGCPRAWSGVSPSGRSAPAISVLWMAGSPRTWEGLPYTVPRSSATVTLLTNPDLYPVIRGHGFRGMVLF